MTYFREKASDELANYSTRLEALWNSFIAGFGFGAEIFLFAGMYVSKSESDKGLAYIVLVARLSQSIVGVVMVMCLYGRVYVAETVERYFAEGLVEMRCLIHEKFATKNLYLVESVSLLTFFDISMLQFMPWSKSKFFVLSEGYPTLKVMKICMCTKSISSFVSVVCEIVFLSGSPLSGNKAALAIFILNITLGVLTVSMDLLVLCIRGNMLQGAEKERLDAATPEPRDFDEEKEKKADDDPEDDKEKETPVENSSCNDIELSNIYSRRSIDGITMYSNPLHDQIPGDQREASPPIA